MIYRVKYVFFEGAPRSGGYSYHGSRNEVAHVIRHWTVVRNDDFARGQLDAIIRTPRTKKEILALVNECSNLYNNDLSPW
jgi:hypothetical protein